MSDPSFLVSTPTFTDPALAPAGRHLRQVLFPAPNLDQRRIRSTGPTIGPALPRPDAERPWPSAASTPTRRRGAARCAPRPTGWPAGWPAAPRSRPRTPSPRPGRFGPAPSIRAIENLLRCGANVQPGVGVPMALISGRLAAAAGRPVAGALCDDGQHGSATRGRRASAAESPRALAAVGFAGSVLIAVVVLLGRRDPGLLPRPPTPRSSRGSPIGGAPCQDRCSTSAWPPWSLAWLRLGPAHPRPARPAPTGARLRRIALGWLRADRRRDAAGQPRPVGLRRAGPARAPRPRPVHARPVRAARARSPKRSATAGSTRPAPYGPLWLTLGRLVAYAGDQRLGHGRWCCGCSRSPASCCWPGRCRSWPNAPADGPSSRSGSGWPTRWCSCSGSAAATTTC